MSQFGVQSHKKKRPQKAASRQTCSEVTLVEERVKVRACRLAVQQTVTTAEQAGWQKQEPKHEEHEGRLKDQETVRWKWGWKQT